LKLPSPAPAVADTGASDPGAVAGSAVAGAVAGGRRAVLTLLDQGFSSISNFAVGVAVARVAGASGFGAFAFAYAGWLILADMHRALITDPMAIEGDVRSINAKLGIQRGFAAEVLLGSGAAVVFALVGVVLFLVHARTFGMSMISLAPWLPALLVQDYWRWMGFMSERPGLALANDTVFNCVQGAMFAALFVTHTHSAGAVITAWGLGGAAGALYGLYQYRVIPSLRGGFSLLRRRWGMSKWLAATSLTGWGSSQAYVYITGAILGPAGLGGLKAAQTLVAGPAGVLIQAGGSIGLPEASKAHSDRGWSGLVRVSRVVTGAGVVSFLAGALVIVVWGRALLSRIYGPQFAHLELVAVLIAVAYIFMGCSVGPVLVLKTTRNAHRIFYVQVVTLIVSLATVTALTLRFGVTGAAVATIATYGAAAAGARWYQHVVRRSVADLPIDSTIDTVEPAALTIAEGAPTVTDYRMSVRPSVLVSQVAAARVRRRLRRPSPGLQQVVQQLRTCLESAPAFALAVVEIDAALSATLAVAAVARSLAGEGKSVVLADAAAGRPLTTLLGGRVGPGGVGTVTMDRHEMRLFVAPSDPASMAHEPVGEDADAILVLATVDPAFTADHLAAWASDAVVMVRSARASATWMDAVRRQLVRADMTVKSAILVGRDPDNTGSRVPAGYQRIADPLDHRLRTVLRAAER
jgi:O-antigen/teichoic acid export membrane protein